MTHPQIQMETVGQLALISGLQEVGFEIHDVQGKRRVAGRIGFAAPVFDEELAHQCGSRPRHGKAAARKVCLLL